MKTRTAVAGQPAVLGEGVLHRIRGERVTERWGTVYLAPDAGSTERSVRLARAPEGAHGMLVACVTATRVAGYIHVGDHLAGIQSLPAVGEEVTLGTGTLFTVRLGRKNLVGLAPDDGREKRWLSKDAISRCHSQTVRLEFRPGPEGTQDPGGGAARARDAGTRTRQQFRDLAAPGPSRPAPGIARPDRG
jgi:hypothetical protein